jgi:hypothetical protein
VMPAQAPNQQRGTDGALPCSKAVGAWNWPPTHLRLMQISEIHIFSYNPTRLHGTVSPVLYLGFNTFFEDTKFRTPGTEVSKICDQCPL